MAKEFDRRPRLIIQGSIPILSFEDGLDEYDNLKIFLKAISPDITLSGQIISMLEPCCKSKPEKGEKENEIRRPQS